MENSSLQNLVLNLQFVPVAETWTAALDYPGQELQDLDIGLRTC
jgi:hypothetical protein